jgi:hypothetical protein
MADEPKRLDGEGSAEQVEVKTESDQQDARDRDQKEHIDKLMFRVTLFGVLVTLIVGSAGFWAAWESRQTRIEDERPFVAFDFKNVGPSGYQIELVDFGKSPARNIKFRCFYQPDGQSAPWPKMPSGNEDNISYILPARSEQISCRDTKGDQVADNFHSYLFLGVVEYQDEDGRDYQTPLCELAARLPDEPFLFLACEHDFQLPELK